MDGSDPVQHVLGGVTLEEVLRSLCATSDSEHIPPLTVAVGEVSPPWHHLQWWLLTRLVLHTTTTSTASIHRRNELQKNVLDTGS